MYKLKKSIFILCICLSVVMNQFTINLGVFADRDNNDPISYVTDNGLIDSVIETVAEDQLFKTKVNKIGINSIEGNEKIIWIDGKHLENSDLKQKLIKLYNNNCKIVIRKDYIKEKEVLDLLELNSDELFLVDDVDTNKDVKRIGVFIQKNSDGGFDIIGLNSANYTEKQNKELMLRSCKSKFSKRVRDDFKKENLIEASSVANASWQNVNSATGIDGYNVIDVNYSIDIKKDSNNPSSGKYYSCRKSIVEAVTHSTSSNPGIGIKEVLVWTDSNSSARIIDYTPLPDGSSSSSGSVSISYPWGVSVSFNTGAKCEHDTATGGIAYSYVQKDYYALNWLGHRTYLVKDGRFAGVVTSEMWQDSTTTRTPNRFTSGLTYTVISRNYLSGSFDYQDSTSHSVSGN